MHWIRTAPKRIVLAPNFPRDETIVLPCVIPHERTHHQSSQPNDHAHI